MYQPLTAIGLMSGTSLDGIDAALIETDGERIQAHGPWLTRAYAPAFREKLRAALESGRASNDLIRELTERHADAVADLIRQAGSKAGEIDVVGFHGQTIHHDPARRTSLQIGAGAELAKLTGIDVVNDFRSADIAAGGEGAPLAPLYHLALAGELEKPLAVLNIGGVANLTWIADDEPPIAFDTGPGNALIDDWVRTRDGGDHDPDGAIARDGETDEVRVQAFLDHPYFQKPWPKSLDRLTFTDSLPHGLSLADGAATLTRFTVSAIAKSAELLPALPKRWLVSGGGRHNATMMRRLAEALNAPVGPVESVGWRGDALEAEAFAFLAVRSLRGLALSLPTTTGVAAPATGGVLHRAPA